jgi:hypothetical protein
MNNTGTGSFSFNTQAVVMPPVTDDGDGISTTWKTRLGLASGKRTLFIKPLYQATSTSTAVYWSDFKTKYHSGLEAYFNDHFLRMSTKPDGSPANVGLQIVVIGDDNNPYAPMRAKTGSVPTYDPAADATYADGKPPVNLITIIAKGASTCTGDSYEISVAARHGHTAYKSSAWTWDVKGYTNVINDSNYAPVAGRQGYHGSTLSKPLELSLHALACYVEEGVYTALDINQTACATNCFATTSPCCTGQRKSATDFADDNLKAAFNAFSFASSTNSQITGPLNTDGTINLNAAYSTTAYNSDQVLTHTLIHEIVHALLTDDPTKDHCTNPCCPMYANVANQRGWTITELGASSCSNTYRDGTQSTSSNQSCTHSTHHGSNNIATYGVVWNVSH